MFGFNYFLVSYKLIPISSKVEKHHLIVRRFNTDARIFCLLISSRTPLLGGFDWPMADAVILYDVDLSLSMARHEMKLLRAMAQASSLTVFKLVILSAGETVLSLQTEMYSIQSVELTLRFLD